MATTKSRPVREHEIRGRINAMKAARAFLADPTKSVAQAAAEFGAPTYSTSVAILIIEFGTPEEIAGVESGTLHLEKTGNSVRDRTPSAERLAKRRAPSQTVALVQSRTIDAEVWGKLRDALDNITGLPSPKDTAVIVRRNVMRTEHINRKLLAALSWIQEFSDEITL